ncbi:SNF2 domain-containing protein CLASSY [Asimina triloba]
MNYTAATTTIWSSNLIRLSPYSPSKRLIFFSPSLAYVAELGEGLAETELLNGFSSVLSKHHPPPICCHHNQAQADFIRFLLLNVNDREPALLGPKIQRCTLQALRIFAAGVFKWGTIRNTFKGHMQMISLKTAGIQSVERLAWLFSGGRHRFYSSELLELGTAGYLVELGIMKDHPTHAKHPFVAYPFEAFLDDSWKAVKHLKVEDGTIIAQFEHDGVESQEKVTMNKLRMRSRKANASDCRFFLRPSVDVYEINKKKRRLGGHVEIITIEDIAILQKLNPKSSANGYERWSSSSDCDFVDKSKLTTGIFMSEISWLLVLSILRKMAFSIKLIRNRMEYIIVDENLGTFDAEGQQLFDGDCSNIEYSKCKNQDIFHLGSHRFINVVDFRRSSGTFLSVIEKLAHVVTADSSEAVALGDLLGTKIDDSEFDLTELRCSTRRRLEPDRYVDCTNSRKVKRLPNGLVKPMEEDASWFEVDMDISEQVCEQNENGKEDQAAQDSSCEEKVGGPEKRLRQTHENSVLENGTIHQDTLELEDASFSQVDRKVVKQVDGRNIACSYKEKFGSTKEKLQRRHGNSVLEDGSIHRAEKQEKVYLFSHRAKLFLKRKKNLESGMYKQRNLGVSYLGPNYWKEEIESCMQNIRGEMEKQDPNVVSQWEMNKIAQISKKCWKFTWAEDADDDVPSLEHEDLWKEMEVSMAALHSHNVYQESSMKSSDMSGKWSSKDDNNPCKHDCRLDEEVGYICQLCNVVVVQIKHVLPPFLQTRHWIRSTDDPDGDAGLAKYYETYNANTFFGDTLLKDSRSEQYDSVWFLIPEFKDKLHDHQKKAFEFLWKNIAGSLRPRDMECMLQKRGGCVVTHPPGTGKTLLLVAFLISYLKLFPRKRPLVLAPKTTIHAWYKEFEKWQISLPIHQLHAVNHYQKKRQRKVINRTFRDARNRRVMMHFRDCFEKLQKWHEQPSILLMSYPCFFYMTRENSRFEHHKHIAKLLRQSPGLLILDEGHNPRSTRSKLRKALMEVQTELRIMLSGTLFQNNFEEYFNTLCLARPTFISETAREFDLRVPFNGKNGKKSSGNRREMLARKNFVDIIGGSITSSKRETMRWGLNLLQKMTKHFVDYYDGGTLDRLPGLQLYTLLMKSTNVQQRLLSRLDEFKTVRSSLELELLVTAGSIHPWLMKEFSCCHKYLSMNELQELDRYRDALKEGPKVMFVIDLMRHCIVNGEKVLIFCRNIPPLNFFVDLFHSVFGWKKNREVLLLHGELDFGERTKVMDKFQDSCSAARVLLASTAASAEGVNLTAASRVVLLDPEWNPSKTKQAIARAFRMGQERVVYVYRLLMFGTLEDEKYRTNQQKDRLARMIFVGECEEDSSREMEDFDDNVLREMVKADWKDSFEMIIKREKGGHNFDPMAPLPWFYSFLTRFVAWALDSAHALHFGLPAQDGLGFRCCSDGFCIMYLFISLINCTY